MSITIKVLRPSYVKLQQDTTGKMTKAPVNKGGLKIRYNKIKQDDTRWNIIGKDEVAKLHQQ